MGERGGDGPNFLRGVLGGHSGLASGPGPLRLYERAPAERAGRRHGRGAWLRDVRGERVTQHLALSD